MFSMGFFLPQSIHVIFKILFFVPGKQWTHLNVKAPAGGAVRPAGAGLPNTGCWGPLPNANCGVAAVDAEKLNPVWAVPVDAAGVEKLKPPGLLGGALVFWEKTQQVGL